MATSKSLFSWATDMINSGFSKKEIRMSLEDRDVYGDLLKDGHSQKDIEEMSSFLKAVEE